MTTYLTKIENGKTYHFRVTVKSTGVDIVHGIFYNWMAKYFEGCGNKDAAEARKTQLVEEKIKDGYQVTVFKESPENTENVYDKAKWHFSGDFPEELNSFQGYIHTGMFLGWLIDTDLISDELKDTLEEAIDQFKQREKTGAQIFEYNCDGVLTLEDLSETGNRFALHYFDFSNGQYLPDYEKTLAQGLPSTYHVEDTWENYLKIKEVLDNRFFEWKERSNDN